MLWVDISIWKNCLDSLQDEIPSLQFNTWLRPLQAEMQDGSLVLFAPNRFVLDNIAEQFLDRIVKFLHDFCGSSAPQIKLEVPESNPPSQ